MFPIKYIDNNLVWNKDNEVFAYYELIPYNYSFLSAEQKFIVHDSFRQLIAQSREGKIHALQIATESSIRSMQEQSKKLVTGKLKEVACQKIDEQTEALVSMIGDNQVDYRFFLGFKLMVTEEQLNLKNIKKSAWLTFTEFLHEVNHTLMNDFVSMPNDEINRYMKWKSYWKIKSPVALRCVAWKSMILGISWNIFTAGTVSPMKIMSTSYQRRTIRKKR